MSYSDYQYPSAGTNYESYSQQYSSQPYSSTDHQAQYDYISSLPLDSYTHTAASAPTDYTGYNTTTDTGFNTSTDTGYVSMPVTAYTDSHSVYSPYQYSQDITKNDQFVASTAGFSDNSLGSFSFPLSHYTSVTMGDQASSRLVSDCNSYQYQPTDHNLQSRSLGQEVISEGYSQSHDVINTGYPYQEGNSQTSSMWTGDQYSAYSTDNYKESKSTTTTCHLKEGLGYRNMNYLSSLDRYTQNCSIEGSDSNLHSDFYFSDDHNCNQQSYKKPSSSQASNSQPDFGGYSGPPRFNIESYDSSRRGVTSYVNEKEDSWNKMGSFRKDNNSYNNEKEDFNHETANCNKTRNNASMPSLFSTDYYTGGQGQSGSRTGEYSDIFEKGGKNDYYRSHDGTFSTQTVMNEKGLDKHSTKEYLESHLGGGYSVGVNSYGSSTNNFGYESSVNLRCNESSVSTYGFSNRDRRDGGFTTVGTYLRTNHNDRRKTVVRPPLKSYDARNKINEARSAGTAAIHVVKSTPTKYIKPSSSYKPIESVVKEVFKAPSRPQDRLLNEIEEKEKMLQAEELKKSEEVTKLVEEKRLKALEEEKKKAEEELRKKVAEEAVKAAPPSKPPETAEEIAHEAEIQRKIRESVVIIKPEQEIALLKADPCQDMEMPEELRKLLKTLTTDYLCKLCNVRTVGSHMAAMHYNGKNHTKKVRTFVQTNGRSAGFNIEKTDNGERIEKQTANNKAETVEQPVNDKQHCKVCNVSFSQEGQAEMHYKGKNHAKKRKSVGLGSGSEVFECKICCVTVTAQEHLTAHLNGARHKLQVRKLDTNEIRGGGPLGQGRGFAFRGRGRQGSNRNNESLNTLPHIGGRVRELRGRDQASVNMVRKGQGLKRHGGFELQQPYFSDFGPAFSKRPRF